MLADRRAPGTVLDRRAARWLLAPAVGLLAAGLAAIHLRRPLTLDEIEHVDQAGRAWTALLPFHHADASGSAYLLLLNGWLHVGSAAWVARLPSVVAVGVAAALACVLGARLLDRVAGALAGLLVAVCASSVSVGGAVGPLALALAATTLATLLFVDAIETDRRLSWALYAIVAALSVYAHATCAAVLVAHAVAYLVRRPPVPRAVAALTLAAAAAVPVVVQALADEPHLLDPLSQPSLRDLADAAHLVSGRNVVLLALALGGALALALGWAPVSEAWTLALLGAWALLPAAAVLGLSIARPSLDPRYLIVSLPALALLAAAALTALVRPELVAAAAAVTVAVGVVRVVQHERAAPQESWPAAVAYAFRTRPEGATVVAAPPRALAALAYYAGPGRGASSPRGPVTLVVVRGRPDEALAAARVAARAPAYALRSERRFGNDLRVQRWERTGLPAP